MSLPTSNPASRETDSLVLICGHYVVIMSLSVAISTEPFFGYFQLYESFLIRVEEGLKSPSWNWEMSFSKIIIFTASPQEAQRPISCSIIQYSQKIRTRTSREKERGYKNEDFPAFLSLGPRVYIGTHLQPTIILPLKRDNSICRNRQNLSRECRFEDRHCRSRARGALSCLSPEKGKACA